MYEPGKDPAPIHELFAGDVERQERLREEEVDDEGPVAIAQPSSLQLALE
jgi:hypothetical protein